MLYFEKLHTLIDEVQTTAVWGLTRWKKSLNDEKSCSLNLTSNCDPLLVLIMFGSLR